MSHFFEVVLNPIRRCLQDYADKDAFFIGGKNYSYHLFGERISSIRNVVAGWPDKIVGLVIHDDLETYASIFALWMEGKAYVPLHPNQPLERNLNIVSQLICTHILDSVHLSEFVISGSSYEVHCTSGMLYQTDYLDEWEEVSDDELAYLLFTSGSTGKPKGVQLSRNNLAAFVDAFFRIYSIDKNDKCLQCFDLSFDLSIMSYLIPLLCGACVFTVSYNSIKYAYIGALIEKQHLTVSLMTPSTIKYLKPYLGELDCSSLKYSLFCGEALTLDDTKLWALCAKNAIIDNVYGPTENTIFCSTYRYDKSGDNKNHNGIMSIGKPMNNCYMDVFDNHFEVCADGVVGELCLAGLQLTKGYYKNEEKNKEVFFVKEGVRWYRSGDLCYRDRDGDFMYLGRIDQQVQIQGFRVELTEIEQHARDFYNKKNRVIAIAYNNEKGLTEIALFVEDKPQDTVDLQKFLRSKMPEYMIPSTILFEPVFPKNDSDKVDRVCLKQKLSL